MSDFAPGDLVVCVDSDCGDPDHDYDYPISELQSGRYYRVARVISPESDWICPCGVQVVGIKADDPGFCGARFRKIDKADEQFTETVRACRPIRKQVSA